MLFMDSPLLQFGQQCTFFGTELPHTQAFDTDVWCTMADPTEHCRGTVVRAMMVRATRKTILLS